MNKFNKIITASLLILGFVVFQVFRDATSVEASVQVGNQYQATTTPQVPAGRNMCPARSGMASSTTGSLGSVIITKAGTGDFTVYDATTTNITFRNNVSTSSLIIASFPSSPTVGTYTFDAEFKRGLLIDYTAATVSTSTVTYRCQQ